MAGNLAHAAQGKNRLGLTAGPVPVRVHADVQAGLLELIEHAVEHDWSARRACDGLGLEHGRYQAWLGRQVAGRLDGLPPGGNPLRGILPAERAAIVELFETWGEIDRSHRKLAHRGSRIGLVHVSESTVPRVLAEERLVLPGQPPREPSPRADWRPWLEWKPNRVWAMTSPTSPAPESRRSRSSTRPPDAHT